MNTSPPSKKMVLVSAVALIDSDRRVLLAKRPEGKRMAGLWEFPGGKVEAGETPEEALIRELQEELGIDVHQSCLAPGPFISHAYEDFHLLMPVFLCRKWKGILTAREAQELAWFRPNQMFSLPMPEADKPLIPLLADMI
jgi:8-oxo-dGTP diphosphatase